MQCRHYLVYTFIFLFSAGSLLAQPPDTLWTKRYSLGLYFEEGIFQDIGALSNEQYIMTGIAEINDQQGVVIMIVDTAMMMGPCRLYDFGENESAYSIAMAHDSGCVIAGQVRNLGYSDFDVLLMKTDSSGDTLWTRHYGDSCDQAAFSVVPTGDSCYMVAGYTGTGGTTSILVMKINADGDSLWTKIYGGSAADTAKGIVQASDGGYVITGQRQVSGTDYDLFIMKVDENGDSVWAKHYGTPQRERGNVIVRTEDNGYFIGGVQYVTSLNDEMYMIRTDSLGDTLWTKSIGYGDDVDEIYDACIVPGQGFVVSGRVRSTNYRSDAYTARLNNDGETVWANREERGGYTSLTIDSNSIVTTAGWSCGRSTHLLMCVLDGDSGDIRVSRAVQGTEFENAHSLTICHDGNYILTGWSKDFLCGDFDVLLMKTDSNGDSIWAKTYGEYRNDFGYDVIETRDNGYLVVGTTFSYGVERCDVLMLKTDANGNEEWMKTYGRDQWDMGHAVLQTEDNGYVIVGQTFQWAGPLTWIDLYIIRTDANGDTVWTRTYGDTSDEIGYDICDGANGGFLIVGHRFADPYMFGGGLFVRIDDNGDTLWTVTFPGATLKSVIQASDNGYIAIGTKEHGGMNMFSDLCLIKIDDSGVIQWTKDYGIYEASGGYNEGHAVTLTPDGGYLGLGYSIPGNGIFLVRTDENGDSLWTTVVDSIAMGGFVGNFSVHRTQDDGYIIAGGNELYHDWHRGDYHIIMVRFGPETGMREIPGMVYAKPMLSIRPTLFNRLVTIDYQLPYPGQGELHVYDATGRLVKTFGIDKNAMASSVAWHGFNNNGLPVPSGTYYIVLHTGGHEVTQKIIFVH